MAACPSEGRKPTGQSGSPAAHILARHQVQRLTSGASGHSSDSDRKPEQFGLGKYIF